jgi:transcriptional regulator with XRE-family HTH domain
MADTRTHGVRSTYVAGGCRCDACCAANTRYAKWRELHGTVLVDSTPARDHIAALRAAGVGRREIARRARLARSVVNRLAGVDRSKPAARVRPETLAAILAVTVDDLAPATVVDALGTRRRLQALISIGWTQTDLAHRTGLLLSTVNALVNERWANVQHGTHLRVCRVFDELSGTPGRSDRARAMAARRRWAPPLAWDDDTIDDPTATPVGVAAPSTKRTRAEIVEDFLDTWADHAGDVRAAALRLGVTEVALARTLYLARQDGHDLAFHNVPQHRKAS